MWPGLGSNPQRLDDEQFRAPKTSVLNHSVTGATPLSTFLPLRRCNRPTQKLFAGPGSLIRCASVCYANGRGSILTSGKTFFCWDLIMKKILRPFSPLRWLKKGSCQLLAKECELSTGKLSRMFAQEQCGEVNWPRLKWHKMCRKAVKHQYNQRNC